MILKDGSADRAVRHLYIQHLYVFQKFKVFPDGDLRDFSMLGEIFRGKRAVAERLNARPDEFKRAFVNPFGR